MRRFKCPRCGRFKSGARGTLCHECERELKDAQRKRQARLARFYHTQERRWEALEKVERAGGSAWFEVRKIIRRMEPYDFFRLFGRRRRWQCFECLKEGTKFIAERRHDAVEHLVSKHDFTREKAKGEFNDFVDELTAYILTSKLPESELRYFVVLLHDELSPQARACS